MTDLTGKILIAPPTVDEQFWESSVIFVVEQDKNGTVGLVLNKESNMSLEDFGNYCNHELTRPGSVYVGGPSNSKVITMLHSPEWSCNNTLKINNEYAISSSSEILKLIEENKVPKFWKLFVGLATWAPGQLEQEINNSSTRAWLIADPTYRIVFGKDTKKQWNAAIKQASSEFVQKLLV